MSEFTKEQLREIAEPSDFWFANGIPALYQVARIALALMERAENAEKRMKAWGYPDEDFICLNCGRETPCMTEADLKPGDPGVPCTFDLTYPQIIERMHYHEDQQRQAEAERDDAIERWARRAKEAEARLESVEAERDRLIEDRRTLSLDELVYGTRAMHEVVELRAERDRLRGDLADALDLQAGHGPTALASVVMERDRIRKELEEAEEAIIVAPALFMRLDDEWCMSEWREKFTAVRRARERGGRG